MATLTAPGGRGRAESAGKVDVVYGTADGAQKSAAELLGVPAIPRNARERLILTATNLCYRNGFNAVGLDRILAEAGVAKTTFYKYFESRDDLLVEVVKRRDAWEARAWTRAMQRLGGNSPAAQLLALFDVLDRWFNDPIFGGCLFINVCSEFPNPFDPVHQAGSLHKTQTRDSFRDLAAAAGAQDAEAFADAYTMLLEGAIVMRHTHHRNDAARIARAAVERLMNEHGIDPGPARDSIAELTRS